jgi:pyruvate dehydrogenase E2 component (dihydrolipoamide acetyltransferase)
MAAKIHPITIPKWGMEMTEGTLARWCKPEGSAIAKGDDLVEIETDKIVNVVEAPFSGILRRQMAKEAETHPVGRLIAIIADEGASDADIDAFVASYGGGAAEPAAKAASAPATAKAAPAPEPVAAAAKTGLSGDEIKRQIDALPHGISPVAARVAERQGIDLSGITGTGRLGRVSLADVEARAGRALSQPRVNASPVARRLARERGIDMTLVRGSGKNGRIFKRDIEGFVQGFVAAEAGPATYRSEALTPMRRTIARRLVESKSTVPHFYLTIEVNCSALLSVRKSVNERLKSGIKVSVNDLLIRATGLALRDVPAANAQFGGDEIRYFNQADVSVAVAIDGGLVTPVIRAADRKPVTRIAEEMQTLAARARAGRLTSDDITGGTIGLSNLGMYGIRQFDAVINPPQGSILAFGVIEERPANVDGQLALAPLMSVTMSCDHRVIDGAVGAEFLKAFRLLVENPVSLVMVE